MIERFHTSPSDEVIPRHTPTAFLAGPVQGTTDWQERAGSAILGQRKDMVVVSPRRTDESMADFVYDEQVAWEKRHLRKAAWHGSLSFWFEPQDHEVEYKEGRAFAQTTRIEIGRAAGWSDFALGFPFIVGVHPDYRGGSDKYVRTICDEFGLPVLTTLDDVIGSIIEETPRGNQKLASKVLFSTVQLVRQALDQRRSE